MFLKILLMRTLGMLSLKSACRQFVVFTLGLMLSGVAVSAPVRCGERPINLAFYNYGFLYFEQSDGQAQGIDKEIVDELVKRSGCKVTTQVMARARIWADLASGALDMSVSGIQNAERDRFAWFLNYLTMKNYAIVNGHDAKQIRNAEDFLKQGKLKFGVVRGFKHGAEQDQWLEQLRLQQRVEESPDAETVFRKLKDRRVDAMFSQPPVYRKQFKDLQMSQDVIVQDWTPSEKGIPHGLILSKSRFSESDAAEWFALIKAMRNDGTLLRIYKRYMSVPEANALLDF